MNIFDFYKKYISPLNPPSCRFYPTCSEYSMMCFRFDNPINALFKTIVRILKCNQLCRGGINYPIAKVRPKAQICDIKIGKTSERRIQIAFWLVPIGNDKFYIIKSLKEQN